MMPEWTEHTNSCQVFEKINANSKDDFTIYDENVASWIRDANQYDQAIYLFIAKNRVDNV